MSSSCKTKNRQLIFICLFFLFFSTFSSKIFSQEITKSSDEKIESIIARANEIKLYEDKYWHILLHYEKSFFGNYKSPIDTPAFFLAKDGKTNPKAEMEANLRAFLNGDSIKFFPARFKWLKTKLNLGDELFPSGCEDEYLNAKKLVNPTAVYLVFPAGYMKNPASMFGHTFLLFENENKPKLLGQSVSYGALANDTVSFIYALKGLFGLYYGNYALDLYSQQILDYRDIDARDIWEYKMKISDEQLDMLLRHTMEISLTATKYYYIGRNCTFYLMMLLDSAYPEERLAKRMGAVAEPLECVKLLHKLGITDEPIYRPSVQTTINAERSKLNRKLSKVVKRYCYGKAELSEIDENCNSMEEKSIALKLSVDYLKFLLAGSEITQKEYQKRLMPVFSALSKIENKIQLDIKSEDFPHKSHDSKQIAITGGIDDNEPFARCYMRLVNHDILDNDIGLNKNTQLSFVSGNFSFYPKRMDEKYKGFRLDNLYLVEIMSLPVSDMYFSDKAIDVVVGVEQNKSAEDSENLALRLKLFGGKSFKLFNPNQVYILAGLDSYTNPFYDYFVDVLPGLEAGVLTTAGIWKQRLSASIEQGFFGNKSEYNEDKSGFEKFFNKNHTRFEISAEEALSLTRNTSISAKYSFYGDFRQTAHKGSFTVHFNY